MEKKKEESRQAHLEKLRKADALKAALSDLDQKYLDIDSARKALPHLTKPFSEMTPKENAAARRVIAEQWRKANPGGDVGDLYSLLNRLDADPSQTGGQMMMQIVAGVVPELGKSIVKWGSGAAAVLADAPAAVQEAYVGGFGKAVWDDIFHNPGAQWSELLDARGGFGTLSDLGGVLKDAGVSLGAGGQALIDSIVQTIQSGDADAITRMGTDTVVAIVAEEILTLGMGKAARVSKAVMGKLAAKVDDAVKAAKGKTVPKAPDGPAGGGTKPPDDPDAPSGTKGDGPDGPPKEPEVPITHAPEGTAIDTKGKLDEMGYEEFEAEAIQDVATKYDVEIDMRPGNKARLANPDANPKAEHIKGKTITQEDLQLGFRPDDEGLAGMLTPKMKERLDNMSKADFEKLSPTAKERMAERLQEYKDRYVSETEKLKNGVPNRVIDSSGTKRTTETFKAELDDNGVWRDPEGGQGFRGDNDIGDMRHGDGRLFGYDKDGRRLVGQAMRDEKKLYNKIVLDLMSRNINILHPGGFWDPKAVAKWDKGKIKLDCANIEMNRKIARSHGPGGKAYLRFKPGGKHPTTGYGSGKPNVDKAKEDWSKTGLGSYPKKTMTVTHKAKAG